MSVDSPHRLAVAFARETLRSPGGRLCAACVDVLGVAGAGITLLGGSQSGPICSSNSRMAALEEMQFVAGEGPCRDAFAQRRHVHAPRLDAVALARWPSFVELAGTKGIGAVFAYPLAKANAGVGVLTLYQEAEGDLTEQQHIDSLAIADVLTDTVLSVQASAPTGLLAEGLEDAADHRAEVHQASGMVSVQLSVSVDDALALIRGHAFATGSSIASVAKAIVARRLRLADNGSNAGQ